METEWQMRAIRGATTVADNSIEAITEAVTELIDELEKRNKLQPTDILSVTFSVTRDLDAIFPAAIARNRPLWDSVAMLDVQQMHVEGSLQRCIRFLIHAHLPNSAPVQHIYLRQAAKLRPDWGLPQTLQTSQPPIKSKV